MRKPAASFSNSYAFLFAGIGLPLLVILAWLKAGTFNPYTDLFLTKQSVQPSPELPGQMRIAGWVFVGLGMLLAVEPLAMALLGNLRVKKALLMAWTGGLVALFGAAFFVAADSAERVIASEEGRVKID